MKIIYIYISVALVFGLSTSVSAHSDDDFDFVLISTECKLNTIGFSSSRNGVGIQDADNFVLKCRRESEEILCNAEFKDGEVGPTFENSIFFDVPPYLAFGDENGSDYAWVNTNESSATYYSRMPNERGMGLKACKLNYLTKYQLENLNQKDN